MLNSTFNLPQQIIKPKHLPYLGSNLKGDVFTANSQYLMKNGEPLLPLMGEFHFSRWAPEEWEEALLKMRAGGIQIVATYVFWIHHEEKEGEWDFTGCRNLKAFLELCNKLDMPVWLRIGPWAHGECRNGGFPDWLVNITTFQVRSNDEGYMELVKKFYKKIAHQCEGMMCKEGGSVLGIQIENEFGHCGGPSDKEEGMKHMRNLKRLAIELGLEVPYYTATGWGGAYVVDGEMLPVMGGYVDAPWASHTDEMPANENFLFSKFKEDVNIGSDLKVKESEGYTFDVHSNPYLTAEIGGGLQVTAHRRTVPFPQDIEAQIVCMLGSGANLLGYYMYHGGMNPEGKYSTLQESTATGYNNDLPIKSYDFQSCIRQSGELNDSYGRLKKIHLMVEAFEHILTPAMPFFSEEQPTSAEDMETPRVSIRHNYETGEGFLFINNHQRLRKMKEIKDLCVTIHSPSLDIVIDKIDVQSGKCAIIPYRLKMGNALLLSTNASLLCHLKDRYFFYTDQVPVYHFKDEVADIITLTQEEAHHTYKLGGFVYITEGTLIEQNQKRYLISSRNSEQVICYGSDEEAKVIEVIYEPVTIKASFIKITHTEAYKVYEIIIVDVPKEKIHELYLEMNYSGDRAEVYRDGKLIDDWFTTGETWHMALKRFDYPEKLLLKVYPWKDHVYYDLPVEKGCKLNSVRAFPAYKKCLD